MTQEQFEEKARIVHKGKYTYIPETYKNNKIKIPVVCPIHGEFHQRPDGHLNGKGCLKCSGKEVLTHEQFVERSDKVHNHKYTYLSKYDTTHKKIDILCPDHGVFSPKAYSHLQGKGCPKCAPNKKLTQEEFDARRIAVHGIKYSCLDQYTNTSQKMGFVCPEHGGFTQRVGDHLQGQGCPKCGGKVKSNQTEFTTKSKLIHNNIDYDYSKFEYQTATTKGIIICPKHGQFLQIPADHLDGHGCPSCAGLDPKWQKEVETFIKSIYPGIILYNDRTTIKHPITNCFRELDIYLPQIKIAFECQGTYFHDEKHFPNVAQRDAEKQQLCLESGITLICIWENEWNNPNIRIIIEGQIRSVIGVNHA